MKDLRGSASGVTAAPLDRCVEFFREVDRYPVWHPEVVRRAEVLERGDDGYATRARALLHVAAGPLVKDFDLVLAVAHPDAGTVKLARVPNHPGDEERFEVIWRAHEGEHTRIELEVAASLSVPRLVPVGGIGDRLAEGFVTAAIESLDTSSSAKTAQG